MQGKETSHKVENEVEGFKEKEKVIDEVRDKVVSSGKKFDFFKLDLERPQLDSNSLTMQEQSQKQQHKGAAGTVEKNGIHHFILKLCSNLLIKIQFYAELSSQLS